MSRVAKYPVELPNGVEVTLGATEVSVKGPLGTLTQALLPSITIEKDGESFRSRRANMSWPTRCQELCVRCLPTWSMA